MTRTLPIPTDIKLMNFAATVLMLVFTCLALVLLVSRAYRHPMFAIAGIEVTGDVSHNSAVTLRANVAPRLQGTFFTLDLAQARAAFEAIPWVRRAIVKRSFPNRLKVALQEHQAVAYWGPDSDTLLVNSFGEVFEANAGELEQEDLPRLVGQDGQSDLVWSMYQTLQPLYASMDMGLVQLELTGRGGWRAAFDSGAEIELGRGTNDEVLARSQRFLKTVTQVTARYDRKPDALETADLRYEEGYAIRLRGVTTGVTDSQKNSAQTSNR